MEPVLLHQNQTWPTHTALWCPPHPPLARLPGPTPLRPPLVTSQIKSTVGFLSEAKKVEPVLLPHRSLCPLPHPPCPPPRLPPSSPTKSDQLQGLHGPPPHLPPFSPLAPLKVEVPTLLSRAHHISFLARLPGPPPPTPPPHPLRCKAGVAPLSTYRVQNARHTPVSVFSLRLNSECIR